MPRFLRLQNTVIHVPSVSNVSMGTTCLGKPFLSVTYHTGPKTTCLSYKTCADCENHFNTLKAAMKEIESLLVSIPLTTPERVGPEPVVPQPVSPEPLVEAKEIQVVPPVETKD